MALDRVKLKALVRAGFTTRQATAALEEVGSSGGFPAPDTTKGISGGFGFDLLSGALALVDGVQAASTNLEPVLLTESPYVAGSVDNAYMTYVEGQNHFICKQAGYYNCAYFAQLAAPIAKPVRVTPSIEGGRFPDLDIPVGSTYLANNTMVYVQANALVELNFLAQGAAASVTYFFLALIPMFELAS